MRRPVRPLGASARADREHPARLRRRPDRSAAPGLPVGTSRLGIGGRRDALVHVPAAAADGPAGLVTMLHGAGAGAHDVIGLLAGPAEEAGLAVLAPDARGSTWDAIRDGFGPDVRFIDEALGHVLARLAVDPAHVALAGFSDGASYALSLGIANGDLFTHVVAFSPGFAAPAVQVGRPRILVTHGVHDHVLPIERCSRRLVPALRGAGYDVDYTEFDGGHTMPPTLVARAAARVAG
jgi:phospholipase/carboxylesterase